MGKEQRPSAVCVPRIRGGPRAAWGLFPAAGPFVCVGA